MRDEIVFLLLLKEICGEPPPGLSVGQLVGQNIRDAVALSATVSDGGVDLPLAADAHEIAVKKDEQERMFPLVFILNSMYKSGFIMLVIQLLFLGLFHALVAYGVVHYVMKLSRRKNGCSKDVWITSTCGGQLVKM